MGVSTTPPLLRGFLVVVVGLFADSGFFVVVVGVFVPFVVGGVLPPSFYLCSFLSSSKMMGSVPISTGASSFSLSFSGAVTTSSPLSV